MKDGGNDLDAMRAQDLLVARANEGLDERDAAELKRLGADDLDSFDLAAAAVDLATLPYEDLPPELAAKLLAASPAATDAAAKASTAPSVPAVAADLPQPIGARRARSASMPTTKLAPSPRRRTALIAGWSVAAAASALAAAAWLVGPRQAPSAAPTPVAGGDGAPVMATDAITLGWTVADDAAGAGASGSVSWSPSSQRGVATITGLAANDPSQARYQLWIFDRARDERYPVHAALFDASANGVTRVTLAPQVPIADAESFLITLEAPGGAVVSARTRRVLSASIRTDR